MPASKQRGHKGNTGTGSKAMARDFEKLSVSKRDSPVRHPSRNRFVRPGQLSQVPAPPPAPPEDGAPSAPLDSCLKARAAPAPPGAPPPPRGGSARPSPPASGLGRR